MPPPGSNYEWVSTLYEATPPTSTICAARPLNLGDLKDVLACAPDTCPGPTGVTVALLRLLPDPILELLLILLNLCLDTAVLPQAYDSSYIYPIPKKGKFSIDNSRPISLVECSLKLLTRDVNWRLTRELLDRSYFSPIQFGFLPGRSCTDAFHALLGAVEDAKQFHKPIHLCLIDLTKAFDSLSPQALELSYRRAGLSEKTIRFLLSLDGTGTASVLTPFGPTDALPLEWGVRQGEVLSPLKFIMWLNPWLQHISKTYPHIGYTMKGGTLLQALAFADDIALITSSHEDMQLLMSSLTQFLLFHGVTLSADNDATKSKTVYVASQPSPPLTCAASCENPLPESPARGSLKSHVRTTPPSSPTLAARLTSASNGNGCAKPLYLHST